MCALLIKSSVDTMHRFQISVQRVLTTELSSSEKRGCDQEINKALVQKIDKDSIDTFLTRVFYIFSLSFFFQTIYFILQERQNRHGTQCKWRKSRLTFKCLCGCTHAYAHMHLHGFICACMCMPGRLCVWGDIVTFYYFC